jgi:ATP-dependent Clp protease ATP-binding subunit ClpA
VRRAQAHEQRHDEDDDAINRMFAPEFRNRLDAIVPFDYLPTAVVSRVVDKFILQLELQLADRGVHIQLDDAAKAWLTERGYDKLYGARPMSRLIQEKIKQPLAEELKAFVDCVRHKRRPAVPGEHGVRAMRVAEQVLAEVRGHTWK